MCCKPQFGSPDLDVAKDVQMVNEGVNDADERGQVDGAQS